MKPRAVCEPEGSRRTPDSGALRINAQQCATCIYRPNLGWNLKALEEQVADPRMEGFFEGYRVCHDHPDKAKICCRGFWDRHKDQFTLGQVAQRLNCVAFVKGKKRKTVALAVPKPRGRK